MSEYSIGQVANAAGIAASAIRYYEKVGLIPGPGRKSGHRRYSRDVFARLALIHLCKQLGFERTHGGEDIARWRGEGGSFDETFQAARRSKAPQGRRVHRASSVDARLARSGNDLRMSLAR